MKRLLFLSVLALSQLGSTGGGCGGQVLRDPGFDLWCGDQLCAWKVERGEAKRVATWHEADAGVELVGADVAIEQLSPVSSGDAHCIKFDLVADVEDSAEVYLNVDVQSDGTLEMHERLPTSHWKPLTFDIALAGPFDGVRFELTKRGTGRAVLANIEATTDAQACDGLTPLDPGKRKNGSSCASPDQCESGICGASPIDPPDSIWFTGTCLGCDANHACGAGDVCGLGDPTLPILPQPVVCEPAASRELGEKCLSGAECASGKCFRALGATSGVCSACLSGADCPMTQECLPSWVEPGQIGLSGPFVCGGGQHLAAPGAPCGSDDDCASGSCAGAVRSECSDGRACSSAADCPFGPTGTTGLQNGACTTVGIQGGTCD